MSIYHFSTDLQETPWWIQQQQHQQSMMETTQNSSASSQHQQQQQQQQQQQHKIPNPQQFSPWPPHHHHNLYHQHQLWLNPYNSSHNHPTLRFNLNQEDNDKQQEFEDQTIITNTTTTREEEAHELEKETMFEKPLTPSDVGKLNRLVIPKQHAEKYFPLGGDSGDKGLLLSFEDESGKCWRFRYSYWNSSQSYVLTKGWSRYVKEKRLDAGDIILFERHRSDNERLFVGWRRRGAADAAASATVKAAQDAHGGGGGGGGGWWGRGTLYSSHPYPVDVAQSQSQSHGVTVTYQADHCLHAGSVGQSHPSTTAGNSKTLRLFGVNLECQLEESEPSDVSTMSSHSQSQSNGQGYRQSNYSNQLAYTSSYRRSSHGDHFLPRRCEPDDEESPGIRSARFDAFRF